MDAHGYLEFKWKNSTLYVEAFGPFNEEGAVKAAQAYVAAVKDRPQPEFAVIEILRNESFGGPDTMAEVAKLWKFLGDSGCRSLAIVHSNGIQRRLAEKYIPEFGGVFQKIADAEAWLNRSKSESA